MVALLLLMAAGWEDSFNFRSTELYSVLRNIIYLEYYYLLTAKIKKATTAKETPT